MNLLPHRFDKAIDDFVSGRREFFGRIDLRITRHDHYLRLAFSLDYKMLTSRSTVIFQFNCRGIIE